MTVRNHLFATEHIVVRGLVSPLGCRLGDHLRSLQRHFLTVVDAEVRNLSTDQLTSVDVIRVGIDSILWAHEFVALTGDEFRRVHREGDLDQPMIVTMNRPEGLTISGWQSESAANLEPTFLVVKRPKAEGTTPLASRHAELIAPLPYILLNHRAPAAIVPG